MLTLWPKFSNERTFCEIMLQCVPPGAIHSTQHTPGEITNLKYYSLIWHSVIYSTVSLIGVRTAVGGMYIVKTAAAAPMATQIQLITNGTMYKVLNATLNMAQSVSRARDHCVVLNGTWHGTRVKQILAPAPSRAWMRSRDLLTTSQNMGEVDWSSYRAAWQSTKKYTSSQRRTQYGGPPEQHKVQP